MDEFFATFPNHAKYVFVILLCPLDPQLKPIPLMREYSIKGNATDYEIDILNQAKTTIIRIGLEFMGYASDGDSKYQ